jgi:hypothetical protein
MILKNKKNKKNRKKKGKVPKKNIKDFFLKY